MKKALTLMAVLCCATAAFATSQVLFEDNFESYNTGDWLGQGNTEMMQSTVGPSIEAPVPGEVEIVDMDGSKVLHVQKIKEPAGVTKPGRDRGVRVPLTWGDVDYEGGLGGVIIIIGKVNIPNGNGYCEVRLATAEDKPMMRFSFHSSDYRTYCYTDNRREAVNNSAANKDDPRWPAGSSDKIQYATADAVQYNTWCDFMLMVDCETGTLLNYDITDNAGFHFSGEKVCQLFEFGNAVPAYAEFTAVGNGYDTNRQGAYLDDIKFVYIKPDLPWATVFVDDFSSYTVGESLTAQTDVYERIGSAPTFSDEIKNDGDGNYAYIWLGTPETGYPKDGIKYVLPEEIKPVFGGKLRFTARYFCPDNGCWTKMMNGADPVATYGFHSANRWFATWGSDDASPRYDGMENGPYNDWVTTCMTVGFDENGDASLETVWLVNDKDASKRQGLNWSYYFDTTMPAVPDSVGVQVQGWPGFNGRYAKVDYLKVEYAAPEPAFLGLLALVGLAFLRKQR
ncbi:hypothetical protein IKS38_08360 [bacterium]|nr:hypothetical protein [bacterium]